MNNSLAEGNIEARMRPGVGGKGPSRAVSDLELGPTELMAELSLTKPVMELATEPS